MTNWSHFFTSLLTLYLPFTNELVKMNIAMTLGELLGNMVTKIIEYVKKKINIYYSLGDKSKNYISIERNNPRYEDVVNYLFKKFTSDIIGVNINSVKGRDKVLIDMLKGNNLEDREIEINFGKVRKNDDKETTEKEFVVGKPIYFRSTRDHAYIQKYIDDIMDELNEMSKNLMTTYSIDSDTSEKKRDLFWRKKESMSTRTVSNTILSEATEKAIYGDLEHFFNSEETYKKRGTPYKRGYCLHGVPGTGKSTIVSAITNKYGLPVFKLDFSIIKSNEELVRLNDSIYDNVKPYEPHAILIEDIDRSTFIQGKSKITMDCVLNILDGVEETYGRIVIMTANDIRKLKKHDALCRPGRLDRMIKIGKCDKQQVDRIFKFYFDYESDVTSELSITIAGLNKLFQMNDDPKEIENIINTLKYFDDYDVFEKIQKEMKVKELEKERENNPDIVVNPEPEEVEASESEEDSGPPKPKLIWGLGKYSKLIDQIKKLEAKVALEKIPLPKTNQDNLQILKFNNQIDKNKCDLFEVRIAFKELENKLIKRGIDPLKEKEKYDDEMKTWKEATAGKPIKKKRVVNFRFRNQPTGKKPSNYYYNNYNDVLNNDYNDDYSDDDSYSYSDESF